LSEINEFKIGLLLVPQSYDYGTEDIIYRIFVNNQLIIERSMPLLDSNQAVLDTFFVSCLLDNIKSFNILVKNIQDKKVLLKTLILNDKEVGNLEHIISEDHSISITVA